MKKFGRVRQRRHYRAKPPKQCPEPAPAAPGSLSTSGLIRLSKACCRILPSGNETGPFPAGRGSLPAIARRSRNQSLRLQVKKGARAFGPLRAIGFRDDCDHAGKTRSADAASGRFPAQVSAACGSLRAPDARHISSSVLRPSSSLAWSAKSPRPSDRFRFHCERMFGKGCLARRTGRNFLGPLERALHVAICELEGDRHWPLLLRFAGRHPEMNGRGGRIGLDPACERGTKWFRAHRQAAMPAQFQGRARIRLRHCRATVVDRLSRTVPAQSQNNAATFCGSFAAQFASTTLQRVAASLPRRQTIRPRISRFRILVRPADATTCHAVSRFAPGGICVARSAAAADRSSSIG